MKFVTKAGVYPILDVVSWSAGKTSKSKTPFVDVCLLTAEGDVYWRGFLTEKTSQATIETLVRLGFVGDGVNDFVSRKTGLFQVPKGLTATVEEEIHNGKSYFKARWINKSTEKDSADVLAILTEAGFDGLLMKARRNLSQSEPEQETFPF